MTRRRQALEHATPVVGQEARRASLEWRQPRHRFGGVRREQFPDRIEGVAGDDACGLGREIEALGSSPFAAHDCTPGRR